MNQNKPHKLYIVIVSYNGMKWLPKCLESTKPYSVIVVDNSSKDGTKNYITTNFPNIILLDQKENLGFGKANNIGISYALNNEADFVFLLNQDAYLEEGVIEKLVDISSRHQDYGILSPIHLDGEGRKLEKVFAYYLKIDTDNQLFSDALLECEKKRVYSYKMINAAAWLITRRALEIVGGFHPMFFLYGEDNNYCQRILYHGMKIGVCPEIFIRHDSGFEYHLEQKKGSKKYYDKFLNQIKIQYGNVNNNNFSNLRKLNYFYLKGALKALVKLQFKEFVINMRKRKLINNLDLSTDIRKGRERGRSYLTE